MGKIELLPDILPHMSIVHPMSPRRAFLPLILLIALCTWPAAGFAQFGAAQIIDDAATSIGISGMATADLNNDGFVDLVTSNGYNQGRVMLYLNNAGDLFDAAPVVVDADAPLAEAVTTADLDQDGWTDIIAISRLDGKFFWYPNTNGIFAERVTLDSAVFTLNAVAAGDVDGDGDPDLVVIGQHSIDLFRNNGSAVFTKTAILTTSTSPLPLECMDLLLVDIDGDSDLDAVTAETIGPVVYVNDGTGTFTPALVDPVAAIQAQIHVADIDGDGDLDIVVVGFTGVAHGYRNEGTSWTNEGDLLPGTSIRNFDLFDADGDGLADAITARDPQLLYHKGLGDGTFEADQVVYTFGTTIIDEVGHADLNNDGQPDVLWSAPGGTVAYHLAGLPTSIATKDTDDQRCIAAQDDYQVQLRTSDPTDQHVQWQVMDEQGRSIWQQQATAGTVRVPLQGMSAGVYLAIGRSAQNSCALRFVVP